METTDKNIKYPYIPEGRTILYVSEENQYMKIAKEMYLLSNEKNHPTGAVVVKDGKIISRASNKAALENKKLIELHKKYCIRKLLHIPTGKGYFLCPGCASSQNHAESRASKMAGADAKGADLYLYGHWWACKPCWDNMIKVGIKNVYLLENSENLFKR